MLHFNQFFGAFESNARQSGGQGRGLPDYGAGIAPECARIGGKVAPLITLAQGLDPPRIALKRGRAQGLPDQRGRVATGAAIGAGGKG